MNKSAIITALALGVSTWSMTAQQPGAQPAAGQSPPPQAGAPGDLRGFHLFPPRSQEKLNLSVDQQKQVLALEIDVRAKLGSILTADQIQQLGRMHPPHGPGAIRGGQGGTSAGPDGQAGGKGGSDAGDATAGHSDPIAPIGLAPKSAGFHLIAPRAQERLALNADQQKQVAALEIEVKGKLDTILTLDQQQQLEQIRNSPRPDDSGTDTGSTDPVAPESGTGSAPERP